MSGCFEISNLSFRYRYIVSYRNAKIKTFCSLQSATLGEVKFRLDPQRLLLSKNSV